MFLKVFMSGNRGWHDISFYFFNGEGPPSSVITITEYEKQFEKPPLAQNFLLIFRIPVIVTYKISFI